MSTVITSLALSHLSLLCKDVDDRRRRDSRANHVPSIYCSAATKEILLRLERYRHRLNFDKGILEVRKQHYKHLKNILVRAQFVNLFPSSDISCRNQFLWKLLLVLSCLQIISFKSRYSMPIIVLVQSCSVGLVFAACLANYWFHSSLRRRWESCPVYGRYSVRTLVCQ